MLRKRCLLPPYCREEKHPFLSYQVLLFIDSNLEAPLSEIFDYELERFTIQLRLG